MQVDKFAYAGVAVFVNLGKLFLCKAGSKFNQRFSVGFNGGYYTGRAFYLLNHTSFKRRLGLDCFHGGKVIADKANEIFEQQGNVFGHSGAGFKVIEACYKLFCCLVA